MTNLALLLRPIRNLIAVLATAFPLVPPGSLRVSLSTPLRGAFLALAIVAAASLTATPGQAVPYDEPCMEMGESTDENGSFQCIVCQIGDTDHCFAFCTNKERGGFECEGWF